MRKHIDYINGLKGFCAICVVVFHYLLAFDAQGFYGWQSGIALAEQWGHYWEYFPLSILTNINYVLYMFFTVIAFIPAFIYFHDHDAEWLSKQALVRYFRFVPYTFFLALASYVIFELGWYFNHDLANLLQEPWDAAQLKPENMNLGGAIWAGLFGAMVIGADEFITSLWCMHIIFIGSYMAYALLFFFGQLKYRLVLYFFLWLALLDAPIYAFFVIGVAVADLQARDIALNLFCARALFVLGVLSVLLGEMPWHSLPLTQKNAPILQYLFQTLGIFSTLFGLCQDKRLQNFFINKIFLHCSRYCFEYILVHALILFSVSAWIFIEIYEVWGYSMAFIIAIVTAIPLNVLGAVACGKLLQPLTAWLSRKAHAFFTAKGD